jgi:hypothetical protein
MSARRWLVVPEQAMQLTKVPRGLRVLLDRSQMITVPRGEGATLVCEQGVIWVTVGGKSADVILRAGERASLAGATQVVIEALAPSQAWFDA